METWLFLLFSMAFLMAGAFLFAPKHLVFLIFLFMNWVVFFLAPFSRHLLDASSYELGLNWPWLVVFGFFHVPLYFLYLFFFSNRESSPTPAQVTSVQQRGTLLYCLAAFLFAAAFVYVVSSNGLINMRIGHSGLARRMMGLGLHEHLVIRFFVEILPLFLPANMLLFRIIPLRLSEKFLLGFNLLVGWLYILINSRYDALVVVLVYFILVVAVRPDKQKLARGFLRFGMVMVLLVLAVSVGRNTFFGNQSIQSEKAAGVFVQSQWLDRIDGMSMIEDIHHGARGQGFMWGAAWGKPLMLNYYFLFDKGKYSEIKLGLQTNPKVLIAAKYRGEEIADTTSSFLDDLYANFSILGLLFGALAFSYVLCWASFMIRAARLGSVIFFVGLWSILRSLYLENEFLSMLMIFLKFLPIVVVFAALYPVRAQEKQVAREIQKQRS